MKNSIPSDVWERKKALIAKLYKDEEWPLKQVIKQIRSADFNPSETQLRSRLKKWRVTKPSRQTRKKSNASQQEDDSSQGSASPKGPISVSPKTLVRPTERSKTMTLSVASPEWYFNNGVYTTQDHMTTASAFDHRDHSWASGMEPHTPLSPSSQDHRPSVTSPSGVVIPCASPYDPSGASPLVDGVLVNRASTMAPFTNTSYTDTTEPCLQAPAGPTPPTSAPISWTIPQWFPMPSDTQPSTVPFYTTAPLSPPIDPMMQMMPQNHRMYSSQSSQSSMYSQPQMPEMYEAPKRKMTAPLVSDDAAGSDSAVEQGYQQQPQPERKPSFPCKMPGQVVVGLGDSSSPFFHGGQHPMMCAPVYSYPGPEPLVHRPPSIGF